MESKMYKNFLKIITFLSILVSPFLYTSAYAKTKVGFVYLTTPGDHGWTYAHELGKQMVKKEFGNDVEMAIKVKKVFHRLWIFQHIPIWLLYHKFNKFLFRFYILVDVYIQAVYLEVASVFCLFII